MPSKLFDIGLDPDLNACVGNNTGSDDDHGYVTGFGQAALALIAIAKRQRYVDPDSHEQITVYMDALIYPIGFCARHHMELFLKRQIARVSSLRGAAPTMLDSTHELDKLFATLKGLCAKTDSRLPELLSPLEAAIAEFARVDPTGQVFRYRSSLNAKTHLADLGIINLQALGDAFAHLFAAGEAFELTAEAMTYEYGQGTYTDKLSREDLWAIAAALPPRDTWKESTTFAEVREDIMKVYSLSGRDFTRAVKVIEEHFELAATIGAPRPLLDVDATVLERLAAMESDETFLLGIDRRMWKALDAIYEVGHIDVYSELYAYRLNPPDGTKEGRAADPPDLIRYVVRVPDRFRRGLRKLGQPELMASFDRGIAKRKPARGARGQKAFENAAAAYERQVRSLFFGARAELPHKNA